MVRRALVVVLAVTLGVSLPGCGSGHSVKLVGGRIEIGREVSETSLLKSVLGIKIGTKASLVRGRLGEPFAKVRARGLVCRAYHANRAKSSLDALDFCMSPNQRVKRILIGVHG